MWSTALFSPSCSDVSWMWRRLKLPSGNRCCWLFIGTLLTYIPSKYRPWESYVTDRCTAAPRACKKVTINWCHPSIWCLNVEIMEASSESPHGVVSRASMQLCRLEQAWAWSVGLVHPPTTWLDRLRTRVHRFNTWSCGLWLGPMLLPVINNGI